MLAFICFRIVEIDSHQRVQLAHTESGESLKVKVPYDQVRPHVTSNLHDRSLEPSESKKLTATVSADKMGISDSQPTVPGPSDNLSDSPIPKAGDIDSPKNEDITIVAHTKTKKRKAGPVPVRKANLKRNVKQLITKIQNGKWLSDEHIDHAQAMLAKQYPGIGGLQAVCVFEPEGCQRVGTPEQNFIQVVNVSGNKREHQTVDCLPSPLLPVSAMMSCHKIVCGNRIGCVSI